MRKVKEQFEGKTLQNFKTCSYRNYNKTQFKCIF